MDNKQYFDISNDGYRKARDYLIKINKLEEFENNEVSIDGYSLIYYANHYKNKESENQA